MIMFRTIIAKVKILPEKILPNPLEGATTQSYKRLGGDGDKQVDTSTSVAATLNEGLQNCKRRKVDLALPLHLAQIITALYKLAYLLTYLLG